MARATTNR